MRGRVVVGMLLIALGIAFGLQRMGVITGNEMRYVFPVFLIALGVGKMLAPRCGRGSGIWLIAFGTIWLLARMHVLLFAQLWPLFLILAGISLITGYFFRRPGMPNGAVQ